MAEKRSDRIPTIVQYLIVVAAVAAAAGLTRAVPILHVRGSQFFFLMAVLLCSYFFGLGPAMLATALGAAAWAGFIIPPNNTFFLQSTDEIVRLMLFFAITICISALQEKLKRTRRTVVREQRRLHEAMEAGHVAVWEHSVVSNKLWVSPELSEILGLSPSDEFSLTFSGLLAFVHPEDRADFVAAMQGSEAHLRNFHVEHRVVRRDGSMHQVSTRGRTFVNPTGRAERVIGIVVPSNAPRVEPA